MSDIATFDSNVLVRASEFIDSTIKEYKNALLRQEYPCTIESILGNIKSVRGYNIVFTREVLEETKTYLSHNKIYLMKYYYPFYSKFIKNCLCISKGTWEIVKNNYSRNHGDPLIYLSCIDNGIKRIITNDSDDFIKLMNEEPNVFHGVDIVHINFNLDSLDRSKSLLVNSNKLESYTRKLSLSEKLLIRFKNLFNRK